MPIRVPTVRWTLTRPEPTYGARRIGLGATIAMAGLLLTTAVGHAQRPLNLDFAQRSVGDPDRPWGWSLGWSSFVAGPNTQFMLDTAMRHRGGQTLRIVAADTAPDAPPRAITIQVPAGFAKGHELRLRGWIRTASLTGRAILQLEEWRDRTVGAADSAVVVGSANESSDWSRHELAIRIPAGSDAHSVYLAAAVQGHGTAWFGPLSLELDGTPISAIPSVVPSLTAAERASLLRRATPLVTVEPSGGGAGTDLGRVAAIVGTARVVGLGESTHGTREFFLVKHRLLGHLVTRLGFRAFAVEANQLAVERINRYVSGGPGPAAEVMRAMFAVWNTEEMRGLVDWIRGHNAAHPAAPVRFIGYDMQDHQLPVDTLRAFLQRTDPSFVARVDTLTGEYRAERFWSTPHRADSTRGRWHRQAVTLVNEVSARRNRWLQQATRAADSTSVEWAVQSANLIRQAAMVNATQNSPDRDSLMAANLDWALRTLLPGQRVVVWAHDVHVSHGGDRAMSFNGGAQLGAHLKHTYRHGYRAFSLLTYQGEYTATRSLSDHRMIAAKGTEGPPGSLEAELHGLPRAGGAVGWVVDVRSDRADPRDRWLWTPRPIRHIGYAAYDYGFELNAVFPIDFDGIVFIDQSSPSRRLR
ncbi:MAG: erythromycin esterase family protein [Gemmatimonadales bacterium]